jgi:hypothetical protein
MSFAGGWGGISALWGQWYAHQGWVQASDDLTKQIGRHSLIAGGTYIFATAPVDSQTSPSSQGAYSFSGSFSGNPIADGLLGLPVSYSELQGRREPNWRFNQVEAYFQDDWKVSRRFTLNLGVRWFYIPHVYERDNKYSMFEVSHYDASVAPTVTPNGTIVANSGNLLDGIVTAGQQGIPRGIVQNHADTFAPRFGFSWDPFGKGKTAIRGGYGIGYYRIEGNDVQDMVGNPPFSKIATFFNPPFNNPAAGVAAPLTPVAISGLDPVYAIPSIQNWSFGIQQEISPSVALSVGYVGSRGVHLDETLNINQPLPADGYDFDPRIACTTTTPYPCTSRVSVDYVRPIAGFSSINDITTTGTSIYHSLQATLQKRLSHGLTLNGAYTWSRAIAEAGGAGVGVSPQNSYNLGADRGLAAFDRTHVLVLNYVYQMPFFRGLTGVPGGFVKGWELTGVTTFQSGLPVTPSFSSATQGLATRPDAVAGVSTQGPKTAQEFFNINAFAAPPFGYFGNASVGDIRGPGLNNWDLGVFKNFKVRERGNLQFRAEMFNAWNHTNFSSVVSTLGSGAFGQVDGVHTPRVMQLALKLSF